MTQPPAPLSPEPEPQHSSPPDLYENLEIGEGTIYSNENLDGIAPQLIRIGRDCIIAPGAFILTHDASFLIHTRSYRFAPVTIGDEVFIGYRAVILPGVTVGDRSIIGACSVVTADVEAGSVMAGVPARRLCSVEELVANQNPDELLAPPYPVTYAPSPEQVYALQQRAIARFGRRRGVVARVRARVQKHFS